MDIGAWLHGLGLQQYEPAFRANDIDADLLSELTEADLERLGMTSLGHRKKLLKAIQALQAEALTTPAIAMPSRAEARSPETSLAERRQLTVLFCDLVGSTALAGRLDLEDLREVMAAYRRAVSVAIERFGGFVAKFMGDGVLAYFGYPKAHEDDPERAVRAGLELIKATASLDTTTERLELRVGIATGLVVVGDLVGAGEAQERGVVGDTPNLAARLQAVAEPNAVVIAASTRRLVGDLFEYSRLPPVDAKGFAGPLEAYRVLRPSGVESRFEAFHARSLVPLVGREEEMELLLRRWQRAKHGEGQVVLLSGEPGIGKSRLATELQERLRDERHLRLRYFCSPYHSGSALHPVISHLERAAGFDRSETPQSKLTKMEALLAPASRDDEDLRLIAELLSIEDERCPPLPLNPKSKKERSFGLLLRLIERVAQEQPLLILFEDVHWIDPTSRELLELLVQRLVRLPVLLILTFRPDFQPPWAGQPHVTALSMNRLYRLESAALVERITGEARLSQEVVEQILTRTDGIPLFIEELTRAVLEQSHPAEGDSLAQSSPPVTAVPATLQASLISRLDHLGSEARRVAQVGSASGREFSYELLSALRMFEERELRRALASLVSAGLIFQGGTPPNATYSFKHALIQDSAYNTLLRADRIELHGRIVDAMKTALPQVAKAEPETLARHYAVAGRFREAVDHWEIAGRNAVERSANREAAIHYRQALAALEKCPDGAERSEWELRLLVALGPALMTTRTSADPELEHIYARARHLARETGKSAELFPAMFGAWMVAYNGADIGAARLITDELFAIARSTGDPGMTLQAHHAAWPISRFDGDLLGGRGHIEAGLALYRREIHGRHALQYGGHDPAVCAIGIDGALLAVLGYLDQARERATQAVLLAEELSHPPSLSNALSSIAEVHQLRSDVGEVAELADTLQQRASDFGSAVGVASAILLRGWAQIMLGQHQEGAAELRHGLSMWRGSGSKFSRPSRLGRTAEGLVHAAQLKEASELIAEALRLTMEAGEGWYEAELHRLNGLISYTHSRADEAEESFQMSVQVSRQQNARLWELRAAMSLARLWRGQGKQPAAEEVLASVYEWFTEGFDTPDLKRAESLLKDLRAQP